MIFNQDNSDLIGAINNKMNIAPERIEMYPASGSSHGGYIDFHYGGNTGIDYTTRLMENTSGNIHIYGSMTLGSPLGVGSGGTGNTSVDTTPTQNSTKMVTSGGVYSAITDKILYFTSQAVSATTGNILDISNAKITADYVLLECTFAAPQNITTKLTWTTSTGHFILNGTCTSATTANITLGKKDN